MTRALVLCVAVADVALSGCAPAACLTVAAIDAAPPPKRPAPALVVRMVRALLQARCEAGE